MLRSKQPAEAVEKSDAGLGFYFVLADLDSAQGFTSQHERAQPLWQCDLLMYGSSVNHQGLQDTSVYRYVYMYTT